MVGPEFFTGLAGKREHARVQKDEDPLTHLMKSSPVSTLGRLPGPSDLTDRPRILRRLARLMGTVRNTQQRTPRKHKNSTNHRKKTPEPRTKKQTRSPLSATNDHRQHRLDSVPNVAALEPGQHLIGRQRTREVGTLPTMAADPQSGIDEFLVVQAFRGGPHTQGVDELDRGTHERGPVDAAVGEPRGERLVQTDLVQGQRGEL